MEDELVRFLLEQSSGVIIALVLILRLDGGNVFIHHRF